MLVDPYDVEAIAWGVHRVVDDEGLRQALSHKGLARAQRFTWEQTAARVWQVLQEAAARYIRVLSFCRFLREDGLRGGEIAVATYAALLRGRCGLTSAKRRHADRCILWQRLVFRPVETAQDAWSYFLIAPPTFWTCQDAVHLGPSRRCPCRLIQPC